MRLNNKVVGWIISGLAFVVFAFGFGCVGGGGGEEGSFLKIKVIDRAQPVSGVYVILHNSDGSVENYKTTGDDGIVDFGDIGRDRITFTIAYQDKPGKYILVSYIDVPFLNNKVNVVKVSKERNKVATINVNTNPGGGKIILGWRGFGYAFTYFNHPAGSIDIYPANLQEDNKLTMVGIRENTNNFSYGYITDQDLIPNGNYTINLDKTSEEIQFTSDGPIKSIGVTGMRKGMCFVSLGYKKYDTPVSSGAFQVAKQFPADYFYVYPVFRLSSAASYIYKFTKYTTLPNSLSIKMPDISVDSVSYNETTKVVSWSVSGSEEKDLAEVISHFANADMTVWCHWYVFMSPSNTEWNIDKLKLPDEIAQWFDNKSLESIYVNIEGIDIVAGFDDFIRKFSENPNLVWDEKYIVQKSITIQ